MAETDDRLESMPFAQVLAEEMEFIKWRRASLLDPERPDSGIAGRARETDGNAKASTEKQKRLAALDMHLSGLAISGGGIRSATFALGVLQGLASLRLLSKFDYLSTVSGGGYIGSWLAAWIKREGDVGNVERQLSPSRVEQGSARRLYLGDMVVVDEEPEPVRHLRSYSNFLTPKLGLFSADTWSLLAIYLRNFLVNLLVLLPSTIALVTAVRIVVLLYATPAKNPWAWLGIGMGALFLVLLSWAFCVIAWQLWRMRGRRMRNPQIGGSGPGRPMERPEDFELDDGLIRRWVVTPLVVAAAAGCYAFMIVPTGPETRYETGSLYRDHFRVNMGQSAPQGDWKAREWYGPGWLWGPPASRIEPTANPAEKFVGY